MTRYLTLEQLLYFGRVAVGGEALMIRDAGLVESALHRPQATVFGQDAYPEELSDLRCHDREDRTVPAGTANFLGGPARGRRGSGRARSWQQARPQAAATLSCNAPERGGPSSSAAPCV